MTRKAQPKIEIEPLSKIKLLARYKAALLQMRRPYNAACAAHWRAIIAACESEMVRRNLVKGDAR